MSGGRGNEIAALCAAGHLPDAMSEAIAKSAVAVAAELKGDLNVFAFDAHIPM